MPARIEFAPALMSRDEAAYYLSMSTRQLDRLRMSGEVIPVKAGTSVRYRKSELDAYVDRLPEAVKTD